MSKVNDGWIKCTTSNGPPEGFRYDIRYADAVHVQSGNVSRGMMWSDRATRGGYWRPSADDGWQLNDERKLTGQVDAVLRYGGVILDCDAVDLGWNVFDGGRSILWWRPAEPVKECEESEPSLLGNLISAADEHERTRNRCRSANEAIRDKMGERDRVIMRHDGDLYLVEWDTSEAVSWVQIDEI